MALPLQGEQNKGEKTGQQSWCWTADFIRSCAPSIRGLASDIIEKTAFPVSKPISYPQYLIIDNDLIQALLALYTVNSS